MFLSAEKVISLLQNILFMVLICCKFIVAFALQLRLEEERCEEAEARVRELEKQVNR